MGGTLAGDEDIVAELSSIDPKVTESRRKYIRHLEKRSRCRAGIPCRPSYVQAQGYGSAWAPEHQVDSE